MDMHVYNSVLYLCVYNWLYQSQFGFTLTPITRCLWKSDIKSNGIDISYHSASSCCNISSGHKLLSQKWVNPWIYWIPSVLEWYSSINNLFLDSWPTACGFLLSPTQSCLMMFTRPGPAKCPGHLAKDFWRGNKVPPAAPILNQPGSTWQ